MPPPPPPPPPPLPPLPPLPALMEELIEEILLRFPPHEPALLVRAALVCKQWCRLVSGAGFRRRFRELHRTPPMLGFLYTSHDYSTSSEARFVRSAASCPPIAYRGYYYRVLDARHRRVLLSWEETLVIWDPITDEQRELPFPEPEESLATWTAAVLCAAHGSCDHLDCPSRPSLVVFVCTDDDGETTICTYSSSTEMWSDTIYTLQLPQASDYRQPFKHSALVGNALYFVFYWGEYIIKYELESHEKSVIHLPLIHRGCDVLVTTVDGGLGLATLHESKLYMWSRKDGLGADAGWTQNRVIDLEMFLRSNAIFTLPEWLLGIADEIGVIILKADTDNVLLTFDLKTYKVKKNICENIFEAWNIGSVFPYMSFYTPALGAACRGNGLGSSSA